MIDAATEMKVDMAGDDVGLVANEEGHDKLQRRDPERREFRG
jgi:hypothetical protein